MHVPVHRGISPTSRGEIVAKVSLVLSQAEYKMNRLQMVLQTC